MRFADGITATPDVPVTISGGIWGARHGIIGPDDPTISYKNNIYAFVDRVITQFFSAMDPHKNNRYVYCRNNPVNYIDPLGLKEQEEDAREDLEDVDADDAPETENMTTVETQKEDVKAQVDAIPNREMSEKEKQEFKMYVDSLGVNEFKELKREWDKDPSAVIERFKEYSDTRSTKLDEGFKLGRLEEAKESSVKESNKGGIEPFLKIIGVEATIAGVGGGFHIKAYLEYLQIEGSLGPLGVEFNVPYEIWTEYEADPDPMPHPFGWGVSGRAFTDESIESIKNTYIH